jgi:hypothetical protein
MILALHRRQRRSVLVARGDIGSAHVP